MPPRKAKPPTEKGLGFISSALSSAECDVSAPTAYEQAVQGLSLNPATTPRKIRDFVGQKRAIERLLLLIEASQKRGEKVGHILIVGEPGFGRATLGLCVALSIGEDFKAVDGYSITNGPDLAGQLTSQEEGSIIIIGDLQRMGREAQTYLEPALKYFRLDITIDQGPNARNVRLSVPQFTCIATTSRKDALRPELLSSFALIVTLEDYSMEALALLATRYAALLSLSLDESSIRLIARSANGTPQGLWSCLQHVRDYALVKAPSNAIIDEQVTLAAIQLFTPTDSEATSGFQRTAISSEVRREVWRRDGGKCARCASRVNLEYDHIIPVSQGGGNTARNIELLCESCNREKSDSIQ